MEYWNEKIETMNKKDLKELQTKKLKATLMYSFENSVFYRKRMNSLKINQDDILSDPWKVFEKMPITTKEEVIKNKEEFIASKWNDVWESSGSSGPKKTIYKTRDDWEIAAELGARTFIMFGVDENNLVMSFMPYGKFAVSGFATKMGADKANIPFISSTSFIPDEAKIYDIINYKPDAIVNFPTKHLFLGKLAQNRLGIDLGKICGGKPIKKLFMGGEPSNAKLKEELLALWKAEDYGDIIGTTEVRGITLAADCKAHVGMHVWEDHNLVIPMKIGFKNDEYEIYNEPVGEGEFGADTYTTLLNPGEDCAFPLIKYHHGDGYMILGRDCSCGRTHMLISYPKRIDKAIIEGGVKFFEDEMEGYLYSSPFKENLGEWQMIFYKDDVNGTFPKEILIENINNVQNAEEISRGLEKHLFDVFLPFRDSRSLFPLEIKLVGKGTLDLGRGKPKRFVKKY